ncbi:MAG: hypothetical protein IKK17_01765, partial [Oscillospiraceae bacterium]|nr:hypothetical protein [Oscillospiraceae bacterium]
MSFSSDVKKELCRGEVSRTCCAVAECYGALLYCNTFRPNEIKFVTASREFTSRLPKLFKKAFGLEFDSKNYYEAVLMDMFTQDIYNRDIAKTIDNIEDVIDTGKSIKDAVETFKSEAKSLGLADLIPDVSVLDYLF